MLNMFNTFFAKASQAFVWFLDLDTEKAESSSKQSKQLSYKIKMVLFKAYYEEASRAFV